MSGCQSSATAIARKRAKVEHGFVGIRDLGGSFSAPFGEPQTDTAMTLLAAQFFIC
ncbi:hypothetical protein ACQKEU_12440 [Acidovorax sp. NPDC077664]|uniref:hypothetical protein n=1 Tax=Acidovorax sp. NPDC077664 TaxID=3390544 RepID=UPI003D000D9F